MKKLLALGVFGLVMVLSAGVFTGGGLASVALADDAAADGGGLPFSIGTDHAFLSKYVWRGLDATDEAVWQPDVWISYKGFTANVWGNMDLTDVNGNKGEFNEFDYTLDYSDSYDKLSYSAGIIHYQFPNTAFIPTSEVYGSLGYDVLLQPSVSVYYDFDEADGIYGTLGISHSFELPKFTDMISMSLDLETHAGFATKNWNNYYYGADHTAFVDWVAGASLPIAIGDHITVSPTVSYSTVLDKTLRTKTDNNDNIIWGAVISASL